MIEIKQHDGNWECWVDGRLWEYHESLSTLLETIGNQSEIIENDIYS